MLLALLLALQGDEGYVAGYAAAILEREFSLKGVEVRFDRGRLTLRGDGWGETDKDKVVAALSKIPGVTRVELLEGPATSTGWELFPDWRLFRPLLADPRWPHFSWSYKVHSGEDDLLSESASLNFGEFFSLAGYDSAGAGRFELGIQAGVFATFDMDAESFDLINADYMAGVPLAWRGGPVSAQLRFYHQSSHLGDEFLLRTSIDRVNLSYEGVDLKVSFALFEQLRLYAGAGYLLHTDPADVKPGSAQAGAEFDSRAGWFGGFLSPVAALDLQRPREGGNEIDISARLGVEFEKPDTAKRRVLLLVEYYRGNNPDGQFFDEKIETIGLGLHLHF
ncbi:MAG TPA: DUF1207 domain-containing protein [Planctomycetota bacterium]